MVAGAGVATLGALGGCLTAASSEEEGPGDRTAELPNQPVRIVNSTVDEARVRMVRSGDSAPWFTPQLVRIRPGGRVIWYNEDQESGHDVASLDGRVPPDGDGWATGTLRPDETYTRTFLTPGVYDYVCTAHASGMVGRVVVGDPELDDAPALDPERKPADGPEARAVFAALDDALRESENANGDDPDCDCPE